MGTFKLNDIELPPGLIWTDEYNWHPVRQSVVQTLDGGAVVYTSPQEGRPVTLASGQNEGWIQRGNLDALKPLVQAPGQIMTLEIRGQYFEVMWRHEEPPALSADPVVNVAEPDSEQWMRCTLKLRVISS